VIIQIIVHISNKMLCVGGTVRVEEVLGLGLGFWKDYETELRRNLIPKTPLHRDDRDTFREAVSFSSVSFCMWKRSLRSCGKSQ
jgi:hypothetical protein